MNEPTPAQIRDAVHRTLAATGKFKAIHALGREKLPTTYQYPTAFVFGGDARRANARDGANPRPVFDRQVVVHVMTQSMAAVQGEAVADAEAQAMNEIIYQAVEGGDLDLGNVGPFRLETERWIGYDEQLGVMHYEMTFSMVHYRTVPT